MKKKYILIGTYGTLRQGYGNHRLIEHCKYKGIGWTKEKYQMTASGIPFVHKNKSISKIRLEIYEIEKKDLPKIDQLEGHPNWYFREPVVVNLDSGDTITASIYFNEEEGSKLIKTGNFKDYK